MKLMAKDVPPTWKNIIFYRRALQQSVSLSPLTHDRTNQAQNETDGERCSANLEENNFL
jgi:hypothetical protein